MNGQEGDSHASRTVRLIRAGIAGNRRFLSDPGGTTLCDAPFTTTEQSLLEAGKEVFAVFAEIGRENCWRFELMSGLAAGADQILPIAANQCNGSSEGVFQLHVVTPFEGEEDYPNPREFEVCEIERFRALSESAERMTRLPGNYADHPSHVEAYRAQSQWLLEHSQIIIAAWEPAREARPAGTVETVTRALEEFFIPVVAIHLSPDGYEISVIRAGHTSQPSTEGKDSDWKDNLWQVLKSL